MINIALNGECNIISTLNTAILYLRHHINKNWKQRKILFIDYPYSKKENLIQIDKKIKKYNVALDNISFVL